MQVGPLQGTVPPVSTLLIRE